MDIRLLASRLYISFGPTKEDLKKISQDKAEGIVGVVTILIAVVLQAMSLNWQENYTYILNPQLHINNGLAFIVFYALIFSILFWLSRLMAGRYFEIALKDRMKAIFEAHSKDKPSSAQSGIIESINKLLDLKRIDSETDKQFIKRVAAFVNYPLPEDSFYLTEIIK